MSQILRDTDDYKPEITDPTVYALDGDDVVMTTLTGNRLYGGEGSDYLAITGAGSLLRGYGGAGFDTVAGAAGNDSLSGGDGNDLLIGGRYSEFGIVFGNIVVPDPQFTAPSGDDYLDGGLDSDSLWGFDGNDILYGGEGDDSAAVTVTSKGTGIQTGNFFSVAGGLYGGYGQDFIDGGRGNDTLDGGNGADELEGGSGNDRLSGGAGADELTGGKGGDTFVFDTGLSAKTNLDVIADFSNKAGNDDGFALEHSVFKGLSAGELAGYQFKIATERAIGQGIDKTDRIIYFQESGDLYFDRDGSDKTYVRVKFAHLDGSPTLSADDFLVV